MRYDHRSSRRGGERPSSRRRGPDPRDRRRRPDPRRYDEPDEDENGWDEPPPRSNALPWVVVSIMVVAVFVVIIWLGTRGGGGGGDDPTAPGRRSALGRLTYGSFTSVAYSVNFQQNRKEETEDTYKPFTERLEGVLTVSNGGGSGSARLELNYYKAKGAEHPVSQSPVHGRTISFSVGPHGSFRTAETSLEAMPLRALVAALFPDLPDTIIDPTRGDTWTQRTTEGLVAMLPAYGPVTAEVRSFDSRLRAGVVGRFPRDEPGWLSCVRFFHEKAARLQGRARVQMSGVQRQAEFVSKASGSFVLDYEHGIPCQAEVKFKGYLRLNPRSPEKVVTDFEYLAFATRIPPSE